MLKSVIALTFTALMVVPAFADEKAETHHKDGTTTETKHDTSHNPMTGNSTDTTEHETTNAEGKTIAKSKKKTKHDEHGHMKKSKSSHETSDAEGEHGTKTETKTEHK